MSIISLADLTDQTEIAYIDYTYIYIYMLYNIYVDITSNRYKGSTYRIERCINIAVWTIGQGRLLEINLNVIGR